MPKKQVSNKTRKCAEGIDGKGPAKKLKNAINRIGEPVNYFRCRIGG